MSSLVSICVPVYNVAAYIERCVHSLMQQTYEDIEYIFVDDCSTDNSIELLQAVLSQYPSRQTKVRILHNSHNHGLAYTRRRTIEEAQGEFVLCVDSDDYIENRTIERMLAAVQSQTEMIIGGYIDEGATGKHIVDVSDISYTDIFQNAIEDRISRLSGKLIRRELFSRPSVHFAPEGMDYLEDRIVLLYLLGECQHLTVLNKPLYHYIQHTNSVSGMKGEKHFKCLIQYWQLTDQYLAERGLTERYQALTDYHKVDDKIHLIHFCNDIKVCRRYSKLFSKEESRCGRLEWSRGVAVSYILTKLHLWPLLQVYKLIIRDKR